MKRPLLSCACLLASLSFAVQVHAATELTFQSLYPPNQIQQTEIVIPWAEDIAKHTKGEVIINVFPNRAITKDTISALRNGSLDIAGYSPTIFVKQNPYGSLLSLPGLLKDARHGAAMSYWLYENLPEFRKEVDAIGVPLAMWTSTHIALSSVHAPVNTLADLKGKKILTISPAFSSLIQAWGAVPVQVSTGDIYMGLQRGLGDMFLGALPFQDGLKLSEVVKYSTFMPASLSSNIFAMNRDAWDDLSDEQREYIKSVSGRILADKLADSLVKEAELVSRRFKDAGVTFTEISPEAREEFDKAAQTVIADDYAHYKVKGDAHEVIKFYYDTAASLAEQ